jgi:hypothetical protein
MIKKTLLSALTALFILPAAASAATTAELDNGPNANWPAKQTLTTLDDGLVGHGAQTLFINITSLPAEGASYRAYRSYRNGVDGGFIPTASAGTAISGTGPMTITVPAAGGAAFARITNVQFSSDDIEFDQLYINGVSAMPVTAPAVGTQGIGHPISQAGNYFDPLTASPDWVQAISLTSLSDGISSQGVQTLEMNVTYIPEGGAKCRVYRSYANPEYGVFEQLQDITDTGPVSISVDAQTYDRLVKVQFSSDAVEFDALTITNNNILWPIDTSGSLINTGNVNLGLSTENTSWPTAIDLTTKADGTASQGAQTLVINVISLPTDGAKYQIIKSLGTFTTDENGVTTENEFVTQAPYLPLYLGVNTINVPAINVDEDNPAYDRYVKLRFDSDAIQFNSLTVNGQARWPIDTSGNKVTLANSNLFNDSANEGWDKVLTLAVRQDGTTSQNTQTLELYITDLPVDGAHYQIYRTLLDVENNYTSNPLPLNLGLNSINVEAEDGAFDRAVKIRFDSDAIEYKILSINGSSRLIGANVSESPSVSIDGTTLSWTATDGTTLQFSDDLESWTSHPSAVSPYTPSTTSPDRFYRTISDE